MLLHLGCRIACLAESLLRLHLVALHVPLHSCPMIRTFTLPWRSFECRRPIRQTEDTFCNYEGCASALCMHTALPVASFASHSRYI